MTRKSKTKAKAQNWLASCFNVQSARKVGGSEPRDQLRWLASDFVGYGKGQLETALREAAIFILFRFEPGSSIFLTEDSTESFLTERPHMSEEDLLALIRETRAGLDCFVDGHFWELQVQIGQQMIHRVYQITDKGKTEAHGAWIRTDIGSNAYSFRDLFLLGVHTLLEKTGSVLARCELDKCRTLFTRTDPRHRYCTPRHANQAQQHRFRTKRAA